MKEVNEVIVAVDGTAGSDEAAGAAARLADAMQASLTLLYVFPFSARDLSGVTHIGAEDFATMRDSAARKVLDKVSSALGERSPEPNLVTRIGDPATEIIDYLDNRQDVLAVMGRRGHSRIQSLLLGSVSEKVVRHTRTPVTVVG